jgi:hypothetical protein
MLQKYNVLSVDCDWVGNFIMQTDLISFLIPILNKQKNVYFAYDHHDINKYFNVEFQECNLHNIDHHHDAGYKDGDLKLSEGNWLGHLMQIFPKKINYTWICNPHSEHIQGDFLKNFRINIKSYSFDYNISKLPKQNYDMVFICCSPEYNSDLGISTYKILENVYGT